MSSNLDETFITEGANATKAPGKTGTTDKHFWTKGAKTAAPKSGTSAGGMFFLIVMPWLMMTFILTLYTFCYHIYPYIVYLLVMASFIVGLVCLMIGRVKRGPTTSYMGMLCLFATVIGIMLGLFSYFEWMVNYWRYQESRVYTDVTPIEKAAGKGDAGTIIFTEDSRVDSTKALGYKATKVYCVAPIMDDSAASEVQFWAAGVNCCSQRADFNCDDAWNPQAKSGVVILDNGSWLPSNFDYYMKAVNQAEAAYGIVAAPTPIFVRWVSDPIAIEQEFYELGLGFLIISSAVYLVLCIIVGGLLAWATRRKT